MEIAYLFTANRKTLLRVIEAVFSFERDCLFERELLRLRSVH